MGSTTLVVVIIVVALFFDYTNGFHDAANAIATTVSTRALTPRVALGMAAVMNVVGALVSTKVAKTVGGGIIDAPNGQSGLAIRGPLAWARIARGLMNSGRNHEEQRGAPWGRAGTVHEARHLARSAVRKAGSGAPGRPDHPAGWWLGWVSFPLAPGRPPAGMIV